MTSIKQEKEFISSIFGTDLLELSVEWIKDNMEPADVFDEEKLKKWAEDNGYEVPGEVTNG